jgi:hypothetical protein
MCPENLINQYITVFLAEKKNTEESKEESSIIESNILPDQKTEPPMDLTSEPDIHLRSFDRKE